jgi:hypothetical protein
MILLALIIPICAASSFLKSRNANDFAALIFLMALQNSGKRKSGTAEKRNRTFFS